MLQDNQEVIEFRWPWTMIPLAVADQWIEALRDGLREDDPLYGKQIFVSARKEDDNLLLVDNDTDGDRAIVQFSRIPNRDTIRFETMEILHDLSELRERLKKDHLDAINRCAGAGS